LLELSGRVACLADVGTDHALLPAFAVLRGNCQRAVAVELREQPLIGARATLSLLGVSERVTLLRGDGLSALARMPVDVVTLAGLSGRTLISWCRLGQDVIQRVQRLIVQPNGQLAELRAWAYAAGLWLIDENICCQRDRFFVSCAFARGSGPDPAYADSELSLEQAFELGPWLVRRRIPEAAEHYARESARLEALVAGGRSEHGTKHAAFEAGRALFAK